MGSQKPFNPWVLMLFVVIGFLAVNYLIAPKKVIPEVSVLALNQSIQSGKIKALIFEKETLKIFAVSGSGLLTGKAAAVQSVTKAVTAIQFDEVRKLADAKKLEYTVKDSPESGFGYTILNIALTLAPLILIFWLFSSMGKGQTGAAATFGKSKSEIYKPDSDPNKRITFKDVAGCDEAKEELQEVVAFLKDPAAFAMVPRIPKGAMLYGEPGTGKTLLARAVAGEANVPFLHCSGSGFIEMFVGVGASRVRSLFESAKKNAPCILFIDEIDALGKRRGKAIGGGHDEREQALNQMLSEMDGFVGNTGVVIIAATNRLDVLDEALLRPGRFDRKIRVSSPDVQGRFAILKIHAKKTKLSAEADLMAVAKDTIGMVGADLENVINEAAFISLRGNKKAVDNKDLSEAVDKVSMGPEMKSRKITDEQKKVIAYHEGGHALIAHFTKGADPVHKITIIPRGQALGYMKQLPEEDRYTHSKEQLLAMVAVLVAGRAAEELKFNTVTTGASNDFERATGIVKRMIYQFSMGESLLVFKEGSDFFGQSTGIDASEETKKRLEQEAEGILQKIYKEVAEKLEKQSEKLEQLVQALLEKETLNADQVREILGSPAQLTTPT